MEVLTYGLPDRELIDPGAVDADWFFWVPDRPYLVLGQSNDAEKSLYTGLVEQDGVTVMKRPSGGESVILTPKTLVLAVRLISHRLDNPQVYFKRINQLIIDGLSEAGVKGLAYRGISDITIGQKKILGSSIYRKKHLVFYHAVLNVSEDISLIARYLRHPGKEPDYRLGRAHHDFVTSLHAAGYPLPPEQIRDILEKAFGRGL